MKSEQENNTRCRECGKKRKLHYDMIYCYAATKRVHNVVHIYPIFDYQYKPVITEETK